MRPIVIDTNCLLQIIARKSPYRPIWDAFLEGRYELCVSNEILEEYQEILELQISPTIAENIVLLILNQKNVQLVDPHFRMRLITADPDDNKFVDCAFAAGADYLVSEDSHFNVLHTISFPHLNLVTLDEFLGKLKDFSTEPTVAANGERQ
ncbi:MAG: putative toxin-antitoxin system toxin component, PIN family [Prevotella sp.]|nr:putative toxin-antitoxin system toxin component, PIN family [Prevotella sp.]